MRILNREVRLLEAPRKTLDLLQMAVFSFRFKHPFQYWKAYLKRCSPQSNECVFRDGTVIHLSSNPHDIITVMINFCKNEYGEVPPGSTVVDIGANIGVFSVYASRSGAAKVLAFEPNQEAYHVLARNVEANRLQEIVNISRMAVSSETGGSLFIGSKASPYNKATAKMPEDGGESVKTIALKDIVEKLGSVDLLKLDCEGAEYSILFNCPADVLERISCIRMELHYCKHHSREEIIQHLEGCGFRLVRKIGKIYWFER